MIGVIVLKRAYEFPTERDGERILVDRLWPRGVAKGELRLDGWLKEVAPSPELRKWFGHDPARWAEFRRRYERELSRPEVRPRLVELARRGSRGRLTLVYAAKDELHNHAVVLRGFLDRLAAGEG